MKTLSLRKCPKYSNLCVKEAEKNTDLNSQTSKALNETELKIDFGRLKLE